MKSQSNIMLATLLALFAACGGIITTLAGERPNVILIMVDDMGYSDLGYHGGEIETPHLDALALGGVRFSQFYNSGRCCPTRATLLTGLHPHETGIGHMTQPPDQDYGNRPPAYQGYLNRRCVTIAEVLREHGYATLMTGKWHLGMTSTDQFPLQRGFDKYYGCLPGATRFFHPEQPRGMTFGNDPIETPESTTDEAFYTTDAFTDYGIRFLREHLDDGDERPFFLYLAYTAPHWPLQAFEDDIAKYRGRYREGWDHLRETRYRRQIELGLIDEAWPLSPRTPGIPDWDSLDEATRDELDQKMAVYAAMVDRIDQNIGKLVALLREADLFDDTLILFLSDNGACQEGGMLGRGEFYDVEKRNLEHHNSYGEAWANAGSTPFRLYKHFVHEGGAATPFFLHWPAGIPARDEWYHDPAQIIDVMPTLLDVAGAEYPAKAHGNDILPLDGISLRPAFQGKPLDRAEPIFIEHETNASARDGRWKLVGTEVATASGTDAKQWELYDMEADRTERNNLAAEHPDKVEEMAAKWEAWAARVGVYPRGGGNRTPRPGGNHAAAAAGRPDPEERRIERPPQIGGAEFTVTATVRGKNPEGVVLAQGGVRFGWSLHFREGRPMFSVRNEGKLHEIAAEAPVSGRVKLTASLGEKEMTLSVGDKVVASRKSPGLIAQQPGLGLYEGLDFRDPVGSYQAPNVFNGQVLEHRIDVGRPGVKMRTRWGREVTPENAWQEYPRPQLRRAAWTNLNGHWDYAVTPTGRETPPGEWAGKILVPFAIEAPLSGVERRITPEEAIWYRRIFDADAAEGRRTLLNFEAVDYQSTVWVNGTKVGENTGGNLPFALDITEALTPGEDEIIVRVTDATDTAYQLHGKQLLAPRGIWYTPVSGIWQTVWLEEVPETHVARLATTTSIDGSVTIRVEASGDPLPSAPRLALTLDGAPVEAGIAWDAETGFTLDIPEPKLWSPDSPTLYELELTFGEDTVQSFFGIRETGLERDAEGHLRFTLNGEFIFHWGTLDQGWWPDGLLTPPSDEAMRSDIEFLKAAGFNTIRKHIKVEPRRYYYHCDRIGMLMWQDQVSSGTGKYRGGGSSSPEWTRLRPDPAPDAVWPDAAHEQFMAELKLMIDTLANHPCIVQWVPFNEAWGQHRTMEVGEWTVAYDPTRQANIASGGNFHPVGHVVDAHKYPHPDFPWEHAEGGRFDDYVKVMGEFGGHGYPVNGHLWSEQTRNWGYGGLPENKKEWLERYRTSVEMLAELKKRGIAGGIYTQTTDVEGEINGLITYDREVRKTPPETLREIAAPLLD